MHAFLKQSNNATTVGVDVSETPALSLQVRAVAEEAIARARRGDGPTLIECETYRFRGHSLADPDELRAKEEKDHYAVSPISFDSSSAGCGIWMHHSLCGGAHLTPYVKLCL
jgi:hypothetical protein